MTNKRTAFKTLQIGIVTGVFLLTALLAVAIKPSNVGADNQQFTFAAAGDFGHAPKTTTPVLKSIGRSNPSFLLMLGDLSYDGKMTEKQWCSYVKNNIGNTKVQILSGNHESGGEKKDNGLIDNFIKPGCLPNSLPSLTKGEYAKQYFFDYPASAPIARFIQVSPGLTFKNGQTYTYNKGSARYKWLESTIDSARAKNIKWVIVSNHKNYISTGNKKNEVGSDYFNLLVRKKVDLVLQGHDHTYQRSKQLSLNNKCSRVTANKVIAGCIVNNGNSLTKGAGTVLVVSGLGGKEYYPVKSSDSEAGYFAKIKSNTDGYAKITVTPTALKSTFVRATGQSFSDSFTISQKSGNGGNNGGNNGGGSNTTYNGLNQTQCAQRNLAWDSAKKKCRNKCLNGFVPKEAVEQGKTPKCVKKGASNTPSAGDGNAKFRIATYNILGAGHTSAASAKSRAALAIDAIKGRKGSAAFDIVGVQEMVTKSNQYNMFNQGLSDYAHSKVKDGIAHTIYWKKDSFTLLKSGRVDYPYFNNSTGKGVWVLLQSKKTKQKFFVFNHHPVARGSFNGAPNHTAGALKREKAAQIVSKWANETRQKTGLPIIILGDLNSSTIFRSNGHDSAYNKDRNRLPYCIYTESGLMRYSFDALAGRSGKCPLKTHPKGYTVDYVLVSKDIKVVKTSMLRVPKASDHNPVYADVIVGQNNGDDGGNGGGGDNSKDKTKPRVKLITPADGVEVDKGLNLVAKASDTQSGMSKVQFYRDTTRISTDRTGKATKYAKKWNTTKIPNGTYSVYAVAYDKAGNKAESQKVKVTVNHDTEQKYPQVVLKQNGKTITIGFVGKCDRDPKGSIVNTPKALEKKNIVAGLTFSSACNKAGAGMNVEISLGAIYDNDKLKTYKLKDNKLTEITDKVAAVDMTNNGKKTTYITYGLTDGGDLDSDGKKDKKISDPIFVAYGEKSTPPDAVDPEDDDTGGTIITDNPDGSKTVTTPDGESVTTLEDGTIVGGKGADYLPNTGTSAVIMLIAGATAVGSAWYVRHRKRQLASAKVGTNDYTVADVVKAQQNDPTVIRSNNE